MRYHLAIPFIGLVVATHAVPDDATRVWTDLKGNTITASYLGVKDASVHLRAEDGRHFSVHREKLSDEDWLFLAMQDPSFLNIEVEVGTVTRAQRPRVSEQGYIRPGLKYDSLRFNLTRDLSIRIMLGNEHWTVPYEADFFSGICKHLEPFTSRKSHFSQGVLWETDKQYYREEKNRVLLRINISSEGEATWWRGRESEQVATILIDDRGLAELRSMPEKLKHALQQLNTHPRLQRVHALLEQHIEKDKSTFSLTNISRSHDRMEAATFYRNTRDCSHSFGDGATVTMFAYIAEAEGELRLKFKMIYTASDWLFIDKAILVSDGGHRNIIDLSAKRESKVVSGAGIVEWSDVVLDHTSILPFASASRITCRLDGQFRKDFVLSTDQLMALREMLAMFLKLRDGASPTETTANQTSERTR